MVRHIHTFYRSKNIFFFNLQNKVRVAARPHFLGNMWKLKGNGGNEGINEVLGRVHACTFTLHQQQQQLILKAPPLSTEFWKIVRLFLLFFFIIIYLSIFLFCFFFFCFSNVMSNEWSLANIDVRKIKSWSITTPDKDTCK